MVLLVPKIYAEIALGFDSIMLITALLFRKPKPKKKQSKEQLTNGKLLGYYLVGGSALALLVGHYAFYTTYVTYFTGLLIDAFVFYLGLEVLRRV
ncbi:hypothetical protein [Sulfolobus spindle-shaped virus]|uniref:hypothetical protein n=1 Tax=Saccharolobus islandicus TaxID=43080 RepID=UPI00064FA8DA|nr:hypothetical protein [Sulfolobus islandicus]AZG03186.1 hypothetical protein [Sulfolobus spindle-shaped virus]AZG03223.1 hypothetical protein [Sulfolobus spindle-shaped virus]AZG03246.1 hypothetical protein [Sulfolobus spindle-shaped virus]AZG03318.1 hypothetical protein [Sulfolobus spindle-shaped virus]AZG03378.1 hypothetical protein [Sulfolobus spindle-shaped virus]